MSPSSIPAQRRSFHCVLYEVIIAIFMTHKLIGTLGTCTYEKPTFYHLSYDVNLKIMSLIVLTVCGDVFFLTNTEACQDYLKNCHQSAISLFWRSLLVIKNASPKILWRRLCRSRGRFCSEIRISGIYSAFTKSWRQDFGQFAKLKYIIYMYMYIVRKWAACNRSNTPIFLNWY